MTPWKKRGPDHYLTDFSALIDGQSNLISRKTEYGRWQVTP